MKHGVIIPLLAKNGYGYKGRPRVEWSLLEIREAPLQKQRLEVDPSELTPYLTPLEGPRRHASRGRGELYFQNTDS